MKRTLLMAMIGICLAGLVASTSSFNFPAQAAEPAVKVGDQSAAAPLVTEIVMPIGVAFEEGLGGWGVQMAHDGQGLTLYDRTLIEDDGPGVGSDAKWLTPKEQTPILAISGEVRVKKIIEIDQPGAMAARLYIPRGVSVTINGTPVETAANAEYPEVPTALLRKGPNEIILAPRVAVDGPGGDEFDDEPAPTTTATKAPADSAQKAPAASATKAPAATAAAKPSGPPDPPRVRVKIAPRQEIVLNNPERANLPPRSFKSTDGGKSWQPVDGEFMVRLQLTQYAREGHMISRSIDLGGAKDDGSAVLSPVTVGGVTLKAEAETPSGTAVALMQRTGPSPVYDAALWTAWQPAGAAVPKGHRYLQWRLALSTGDPLKSPVAKSVTVAAQVVKAAAPAWSAQAKVTGGHNEEIRYTSMPFEYEDSNHPKMKALREKYKLDEVVKDSKSELEKLAKLNAWVSRQWRYKPPEDHFPAWDADEILTLKYGFCVQYAIVYMQCATALGYQTRFLFGNNYAGGHEYCEVWSNEHKKWVFMDPNNGWFHADPKTKAPLSMLEVHDLILKHYYKPGEMATYKNRVGEKDRTATDQLATCYKGEVVPAEKDVKYKDGKYRMPARWMSLRYMPRNNFYAHQYPVARAQGWNWDWADYWCWEDAQVRQEPRYRHFTSRRSDISWTINQVRFEAAWSDKPGTVNVQMGTVTPNFKSFMISTDGQNWKGSDRSFAWPLQKGKNRLEMKSVNSSGVAGPVSFIEIEYAG